MAARGLTMGKSVYFSDQELIQIESALEVDGSADVDAQTAINTASFKVGLALERPWALKKQSQNNPK
jgi:hypothetical protein